MPRTEPRHVHALWVVCVGVALIGSPCHHAAQAPDHPPASIDLRNPLPDTVFPPEMPPVLFRWEDNSGATVWGVTLELPGLAEPLEFVVRDPQWKPTAATWTDFKARSVKVSARVVITGYSSPSRTQAVSQVAFTLATSKDPVGASLFYREVNLPFAEAVKDPSQIRWRFGPISSPEPPRIVLQNLPVCGNCHSFSSDGRVLGMDVDYANSKASYIITPTAPEMALAPKDIISWDQYRREDGELTFGLLSQVSPDGRRVISTVKDKSVFVPRPDLAFSQLFFPIKGILVVFDRASRTFAPLPGADDPACVQSNPAWSPDGRYVVFARTKAYDLSNAAGQGKVLLTPEECREFTRDGKPFRYDLYRVPYNDGKGGPPEPLEGASHNDQSNYFPRYSPDGKWIVFCKAANYMLLQPDSELYIIPAEGGPARRLRANTARMNSWHSWSPNSRWLVFSSKANSPYTQLFLTHIDEAGESTPPVLLEHLSAPDRAANIPEFVNLPPGGIARIDQRFLNDYSFERAGNEFYRGGDPDRAIEKYRRALELNPANVTAHQRLGFLLYHVKHQFEQGLEHTSEALRLDPENGFAHNDLAVALMNQGQVERAIPHLQAALRLRTLTTETQYQPQTIHSALGEAWLRLSRYPAAAEHYQEAVRLNPAAAAAHYWLALALVMQGQTDGPLEHYSRAVNLNPHIDTSVALHDALAANYARNGRLEEALRSAEHALELARRLGKEDLAVRVEARLLQLRNEQKRKTPGGG